jgi:hypothetical protein
MFTYPTDCTKAATHHIVVINNESGQTADSRTFCDEHTAICAIPAKGYNVHVYELSGAEQWVRP